MLCLKNREQNTWNEADVLEEGTESLFCLNGQERLRKLILYISKHPGSDIKAQEVNFEYE